MNWMKALLIFIIALILGAVLGVIFISPAKAVTQVTICHNNGQSGNYSKITVDWNAVDGDGNGDHNRSGHQDGKDIIPPGFWDLNGRNWNTEGQAIWNNNCVVPPVDVCDNIDGEQATVPDHYYQDKKSCYPQTPVCTDREALNYDSKVEKDEYEDKSVCEYKQEKHVEVIESCDGGVKVTIWGGDTRRTWRVEGVEAWIDYWEHHEFSASSLNVVIEWKHEGKWKVADESYVTRTKAEGCEPAKPDEGFPQPQRGAGEEPKAPMCSEPAPVIQPRNFGCYRNGVSAHCMWVPGDEGIADIFYTEGKVNTPPTSWNHALVVDYSKYAVKGQADIFGLVPGADYSFALRSRNACSGGQFVYQVVVDSDSFGKYFPLTYWYQAL